MFDLISRTLKNVQFRLFKISNEMDAIRVSSCRFLFIKRVLQNIPN